jgi:O-antigen/teichoic acid export membrane protein
MAGTVALEPESSGAPAAPKPTSLPASASKGTTGGRFRQFIASLTDQGLAVAGMFLVNIALARAQTKEEYGMFTLSYSIYTFLMGLQNAVILEPYTVHGAGRYHEQLVTYTRRMAKANIVLGLVLSALLASAYLVMHAWHVPFASDSFLGLAIAVLFLFVGLFIRRTFYLQKRPDLAARFSIVTFLTLTLLLGVAIRTHTLTGLTAFAIAAAATLLSCLVVRKQVWPEGGATDCYFFGSWREHWKYARWVLATAFVCQFTSQAYYWLLGGIVSVKEVGEMRAMYLLVGPVDQLFIALNLLVLPMMAYRYASGQTKSLIKLWKQYGLLTVVVTALYTLAIVMFGRHILHAVYGGKFDDVASVLSIFAFFPIVMGIGNGFNVALKSLEKPDFVLRAYLASGIATLVLGIPLVRSRGLQGAVWGILISATVYAATMLVGFRKMARLRLVAPTVSAA